MRTIGLDISVLSERQKTGIAVYTYELIKALLKINKKDKFILFGIASLNTYKYLNNIEFKNQPNVEMKIFRMPSKLFRLGFLTWQKLGWPFIENLIGTVDIFHSFNWYLPPQKAGKQVATIFDLTSVMFPQWHLGITSDLDRVRFARITQKADLVLTISENSKKDFLKYAPGSRTEVIYPAADETFNQTIKKGIINRVLKKYSLKPGFFLAVGTLEPRKNLDTLIKAFIESNSSGVLVVVGKVGWKSDTLVNLMAKNKKRVRMVGYVPNEDLKALYSQALCLVYPSYYEGFGIPVLEAMSCGTPVISSSTSSLPEVGGKAVLYVDPYSKTSIVEALKLLALDGRLREKLSKAGLKQSKKFSWDKSAKQLNNIYKYL